MMVVFLGFLKAVLRVILKWAIRLIIAQLIYWLIQHAVAWLLDKYKEEVKKLIQKFNDDVVADVFNINTLLSDMAGEIYDVIDSLIDALTAKIDALTDDVLPNEIDRLLLDIKFEEFMTELTEDITLNAGALLETVLQAAMSPINAIVSLAKGRIETIITDIETLNRTIEQEIKDAYESAIKIVDDYVSDYNARTAGIVSDINGLADMLNYRIHGIHAKVDSQENAIDIQQAGVATAINGLETYLNAALIFGAILTAEDIETIAQGASDCLDDQTIHVVPINFDDYRGNLPDPNLLICTLTPPQITRIPNFEYLIQYMDDLCLTISDLQSKIDALPENIKQTFNNVFPDYLQTNPKEKIKALIQIALVRIVINKRRAILAELDAKKAALIAKRTETATGIIDKTKAIKKDIAEYEKELVENLPTLIQPVNDAYLEEIEGQLADFEDSVMVNIDQIAPDVLGIDHLIESFPSAIRARELPNKSDSEKFHINDIYRLLCNYFDRAERIALILHLADQDLPSDIADFTNLNEKEEE